MLTRINDALRVSVKQTLHLGRQASSVRWQRSLGSAAGGNAAIPRKPTCFCNQPLNEIPRLVNAIEHVVRLVDQGAVAAIKHPGWNSRIAAAGPHAVGVQPA